MTAQLQHTWEQSLQGFTIDQERVQSSFMALVDAYSSPGRVYHTLDHIEDMLRWIERMRNQVIDLPTIQLATWFHDSIYDPRADDNEERSAIYAQNVLSGLELPVEMVQAVAQMILSTKAHQVEENNQDCQILLDADLTILGAPILRYDAYAQAIRQEYGWVPETSYRSGRVQVLQSFLQRPRIYETDFLYTTLEAQARENIRREIASQVSINESLSQDHII